MAARRRGLLPVALLCALALSMLHGRAGMAAEWSFEPSASVKGEVNDNIRLTTLPHDTVYGITVSPALKLAAKSATWDVSGQLQLNVNRYSGESGLDTEDQLLNLRSRYNTELDRLSLNAAYLRDSTLATELLETGFVGARRQRRKVQFDPGWTRKLTERMSASLNLGYTDVGYEDKRDTLLVDYSNRSLAAGLAWSVSEREEASASLSFARLETSPASFAADTAAVQFGYVRAFSETLQMDVALGYRSSESTVFGQALVCTGPIVSGTCTGLLELVPSARESRAGGLLLNAGLRRQLETGALTLRASREVVPSAIGPLVETDRLALGATRKLTETLTARLDVALYRTRFPEAAASVNDGRYYRIEPGISWRLTPDWTCDATYWHARQTYDAAPNAARVNAAYAMLTYRWPKAAVSR